MRDETASKIVVIGYAAQIISLAFIVCALGYICGRLNVIVALMEAAR